MKQVRLSKGKFAKVDDADFERVSQYKWSFHDMGYAFTNPGPREDKTYILMHRFVNKTPHGMSTDHINGDKLDNRRGNLRDATHAENKWNKPAQANNTSGYKGVSQNKSGTWDMQIRAIGKRVSRRFSTKEAAALAYNDWARKLHGQFAYQNKVGELS
jgi:hypothetical protein